ncbi:MAG: FadR family transcriptional regulator [Candidatus Tectomicrobia bacterium]|nr:FadR family transcriptional regulator [Candidatus Tectomicrobia bacterium]
MQLQEVKKNRVYEAIVTQVQDLIAQGQLKSGDRLPPERDLVEAFNVSRASVREAICVLESLGLVESRVGSGTYVRTSRVENLIQPLALAILQEQDNLREIFEARRLIEPYLAGLAAERATEEEKSELEAIVKRHGQLVSRGETGAEADVEFHLTIARVARNQVLLRLIDGIHDLLRKTRDPGFQTGGRPKRSFHGHSKVLQAILRGDTQTARAAMDEHLAVVEEFVRKNLEELSADSEEEGRAGRPASAARSNGPSQSRAGRGRK